MMLHERYGNRISILTNGKTNEFTNDQSKLLTHYNIAVHDSRICGTIDEGSTSLRGFKLEDDTTVKVNFAMIAMGLNRVYNDLAVAAGCRLMDEDMSIEKRHIWIDKKGETSVENFFVVGDAAKRDDEPVMKQIYTAQEYAVRAVDSIDLRKRKAQRAGILN